MEKQYFPLGSAEDNRIVKILRIILGAACIVVAGWWLVFGINSSGSTGTLWITIAFLAAFGSYQIWAGLGKASRFIALGSQSITVRKNAILPAVTLSASDLSKIDIYPLSIIFIQNSGKKLLLRLGAINYETNEKIIDELIRFAEENNIKYEVIEEEI